MWVPAPFPYRLFPLSLFRVLLFTRPAFGRSHLALVRPRCLSTFAPDLRLRFCCFFLHPFGVSFDLFDFSGSLSLVCCWAFFLVMLFRVGISAASFCSSCLKSGSLIPPSGFSVRLLSPRATVLRILFAAAAWRVHARHASCVSPALLPLSRAHS